MKNYLFIGKVMGAKLVTRKNKTTNVMESNCEVIVQFEDYDINGELVLDTDVIQYDTKSLDEFKSNVGKFVAIPHLFLSTPKGTWIFRDEIMKHNFYVTNPLFPIVNNITNTNQYKTKTA